MWGNLSDFAKIAQEQALKFNLDNMAEENEDDKKHKVDDLQTTSQQNIFTPVQSSKSEPSQNQKSLFSPLSSQITQSNDTPKKTVSPTRGDKLIVPTPNKINSQTSSVEQQPRIENETKDLGIASEEGQTMTIPVENDGSVSSKIQENIIKAEGDMDKKKDDETNSGNINLDQVSLNMKKDADTTAKEHVILDEKSETTKSESNEVIVKNIECEERSQIDELNNMHDDLDTNANQMNTVSDVNNDALKMEGMEIDELAVSPIKVMQKEINVDSDPSDTDIGKNVNDIAEKSKNETDKSSPLRVYMKSFNLAPSSNRRFSPKAKNHIYTSTIKQQSTRMTIKGIKSKVDIVGTCES